MLGEPSQFVAKLEPRDDFPDVFGKAIKVGLEVGLLSLGIGPGEDIHSHKRTSSIYGICERCPKAPHIGLCYDPAGVGKTLSARRYAHWDVIEPFLEKWPHDGRSDSEAAVTLARTRTIFYTPSVSETLRDMRKSLGDQLWHAEDSIDRHLNYNEDFEKIREHKTDIELLIFDEAERLSMNAVEYIRSIFDKKSIGVMLVGMPGMEKRLARFPQFYSRVGFAHNYRPLTGDELTFVLTSHWRSLGINLDDADFTDAQAVATIARITGGNFRLLHRLFTQIERIMKINDLTVITDDVVEAARSTLVIGVT
jgi:DNA transposition AAA+ family ATPase